MPHTATMTDASADLTAIESGLAWFHRSDYPKRSRCHAAAVLVIAIGIGMMIGQGRVGDCFAQVVLLEDIERPFIENEPFDLITLDRKNNNAIIQIEPADDVVIPLPKKGNLVFEFFDGSESRLQVPYAAVTRYQTFSDLLLSEADQFLASEQYASAFRNLLYIYDNGGKKNPKVVEALRSCLFLDARQRLDANEFELALTIFEDLYRQQPDFKVPGVDKSLIEVVLDCYQGILESKFEQGDYAAVKALVAVIDKRYGDPAKKLTGGWVQRFSDQATKLLEDAKAMSEQGRGREAHLLSRQAQEIQPGRADIEKAQEELMAKFPLIVVGVSQTADAVKPNHISDWGARRIGRLIQRSLVEITGLGDEGARYEFLNGTIARVDDLGLMYSFDLDLNNEAFGVPKISAFELASRLLAHADPNSAGYDPTWEKVLKTVQIESDSQVLVTLRRPFVRPEALLQIPFQESASPGQRGLQDGVYTMQSKDDVFSIFSLNSQYAPVEGRQHPVIIEHLQPSDTDAVDALLRGEVDIVDRIPPADLKRLKEANNIEVRTYTIPTIHMLIVKIRGRLKDSYRFKNALSTAIPRDTIIREAICGGQSIDGCVPISGPFPLGGEDSDQISYGYDLRVKPFQHNERLAMVLKQLSITDEKTRAARAKQDQPPLNLSLVLAHPAGTTAKAGAERIALAWTSAGIPTTLRALGDGESYPEDDQWDLLYSEVFMEEPLVDASRLFGINGLTDDISAPVEQSLQNLVTSQTWQGTCLALRNIHRQISTDLSVIPLYQVQEHYAYRDNVYNLGRELVHLYQNVDRWTIETAAMAERRKRKEQNE